MLRVIIGFITFVVFAAYILGAILSVVIGAGIWMIGIGAFLGFYIAWSIAGGVIFSPFSYFVLSDWNLFKTKLKYSVGGSGVGAVIGFLIAYLSGY